MLTDLDNQLLAALRKDGRASVTTLAARLGVQRSTIRTRIERMEARGDIQGFTVLTKSDVKTAAIRGLMMLEISGRGAEKVSHRLTGLAEVSAVHSTNGKWDLIAEIGARTLEEFDNVLTTIRRMDDIKSSETSILLSTRR